MRVFAHLPPLCLLPQPHACPLPLSCRERPMGAAGGCCHRTTVPSHGNLLSHSAAGPPSHSTHVAFVPLPRPKSLLRQLPAAVVWGAGRITPHPGGAGQSCRENVRRTGWWRADCALVPVIIPICYFPVSSAAEETHKASQV